MKAQARRKVGSVAQKMKAFIFLTIAFGQLVHAAGQLETVSRVISCESSRGFVFEISVGLETGTRAKGIRYDGPSERWPSSAWVTEKIGSGSIFQATRERIMAGGPLDGLSVTDFARGYFFENLVHEEYGRISTGLFLGTESTGFLQEGLLSSRPYFCKVK